MPSIALELNDRAVGLARAGKLLSSSPSVVHVPEGSAEQPLVGTPALQHARAEPTRTSTRHLGAVLMHADAASASEITALELRQRSAGLVAGGARCSWIVTPARANAAGLSQLLALAGRAGLQVAGFIDGAVVTAAGLELAAGSIVLEIGLHHAAAVRVEAHGGRVRRRRALVSEGGGLLELQQAWLDLIRGQMIAQTRFDPLHFAAAEQQLFDALPELSAQVVATGEAAARVHSGSALYEVRLQSGQLAQASQPLLLRLAELAHRLRAAGEAVDIVVPLLLAGLPGARAVLDGFSNCRVLSIPDGFAAVACSSWELYAGEGDTVRWLRGLPAAGLGGVRTLAVEEPPAPVARASPSHVLFGDRAHAVHERLPIGRGVDGHPALLIPADQPGVSRRHCTLVRERHEVSVVDHSSCGTFLNGERVAERARVYAGDQIRLGHDGPSLALIALGGRAAPGG